MALMVRACERASWPNFGTILREPISILLIIWLAHLTGATYLSIDANVSFWGTKQHMLGLVFYVAVTGFA
jgi:hypothetical protein